MACTISVSVGLCVQFFSKFVLPVGQAFDRILTLDMQIFGQSLASFGPSSQAIITQGVANFLRSGVTASQITLTVKDTIAAVRTHFASNSPDAGHLASPKDQVLSRNPPIISSQMALLCVNEPFVHMQPGTFAHFRS